MALAADLLTAAALLRAARAALPGGAPGAARSPGAAAIGGGAPRPPAGEAGPSGPSGLSALAVDVGDGEEAAFLLAAAGALADLPPLSRLGAALPPVLRAPAPDLAPLLAGLAAALDEAARRVAAGAAASESVAPTIAIADHLEARRAVSTAPAPGEAGTPARPGDEGRRGPGEGRRSPGPAPAWTPLCDDRLLDAFIEEAGERLEALGQKLVQLEGRPEAGELIGEVFRDLHTLKGSAAFVGLQPMTELAHRAEDLVGQLRKGERPADRAAIDALLAALDGLRAILDRATARAPVDLDLAPLCERLASPSLAPAPGPSSPPPAAPPERRSRPPRSQPPARRPPSVPPAAPPRHTLRIDFDKLDLLLNLVGELVVSKARLHTGLGSLSALSHDLGGRLRRARRRPRQRAALGAGLLPAEGRATHAGPGAGIGAAPTESELGRLQRLLGAVVHELADGGAHLDHVAAALRDQVMKLRMVPVSRVFNKHHRTVRELALQLGKQVRLEIEGAETELDKMLVEQLDDPLVHLVRNALDHGIEPPLQRAAAGKPPEGTLRLRARHRGSQIIVEVADDGRGIDPLLIRDKAIERGLCTAEEVAAVEPQRLLELLFRPGFSTAVEVSEISGRGVGLDVVQQAVQRLKGTIEIQSEPGKGTTFVLRLPLTLAIIQVLVVQLRGELYTLPLDAVSRALRVPAAAVHRLYDRDIIHVPDGDGRHLEVPLIDLAEALELPPEGAAAREALQVVLVGVAGSTYGLVCDRQLGKREIVIKSLGDLIEEAPCIAGATLIDDRVVLLLDLGQIVQRVTERRSPLGSLGSFGSGPGSGLAAAGPAAVAGAAAAGPRRGSAAAPAAVAAPGAGAPRAARLPRILVVEDSAVERESLCRLLREAGFEVVAAADGRTAAALAESEARGFDLISTDLTMPDVDGYELTRRLRAQPRHRDVPILMLSARSEPIDRLRGFDAGVDEYLLKPVDPRRLLGAVRRHLSKPRGGRAGAPRPGAPAGAAERGDAP